MKRATLIALWAICLLLATVRFFVPTHAISLAGGYEAVAHLFVGGLLGAYWASRKWNYLWMALAISGVELLAFALKTLGAS